MEADRISVAVAGALGVAPEAVSVELWRAVRRSEPDAREVYGLIKGEFFVASGPTGEDPWKVGDAHDGWLVSVRRALPRSKVAFVNEGRSGHPKRMTGLTLSVLILVLAVVGGALANTPGTAHGAGEPTISLFAPVVGGRGVLVNGVTLPGAVGATITRISWDWGDGTVEDSFFPAFHAYGQPGKYAVVATSHQSDGLTARADITVQFRALPFRALLPLLSFDENDVALTSVEITRSSAGQLGFDFRVTNLGSSPVTLGPTWTVQAWVSVDPILDRVLDLAIGGRPLGPPRSLMAGSSFEDTFLGDIPGGSPAGFFYLIVEVQSHGALQEANYGNNHLIVRLGAAPVARVTWHLPASYTFGRPSSFLVEVCNDGGDAHLTTSGTFGGVKTGTGEYSLPSGGCIGLGYGDEGPIITSQHIQNGQVCIFHSSMLTNLAGTSSYSETRCVPVVGTP